VKEVTSIEQADVYALVYGNMVNSERAADFIQHVSGQEAVDFDSNPSEILVHGEHLKPVNLTNYRRDFTHEMSYDLLKDEWKKKFDTIEEFLSVQYPETENRGGLNIQPETGSEINSVLVPMTDEELRVYEDMELGYHLENIPQENIDIQVDRPVFAAVSHNKGDVDPMHGYVRDCAASWSDWNENQMEKFLKTTHVGEGTLYEWASKRYFFQ